MKKRKEVIAIICVIFVFAGLAAKEVDASKRRLIWTLSNHKKNSDKLEFSGVPVQCFIGRGRAKGTFITNLVKNGPAYNAGLRAGDVLLKINDRVIYNARIADSTIQRTGSGVARVEVAKTYGNSIRVKRFNANWSNLVSATRRLKVTSKTKTIGPKRKAASVAQLESYLFKLVNKDRRENGNLPPYKKSSKLSALARKYAQDQVNRNFTGHRDPDGRMPIDRAVAAGISVPIGENVAFCEGDALTISGKVKWCQDSMMNEPPNQQNHRGAILSTHYKYLGVGVAIRKDGRVHVAQEFSPDFVP